MNKTRVLVLTSVFPRWRGDATPPFVQNQVELMVRRGYDVLVLAPHSKGATFSEKVNGVKVKRHGYMLPWRLQCLCYEGGMLVNLKARPWTKCLLPFFYLSQLICTLYFCAAYRPHLIHSHSLLPQGLTGAICSRLLNIPHITTSHGNDVFGLKASGLMRCLKRIALLQADLVTVNSSATKAAVLELEPKSDCKVRFIPAVPNEGAVDQTLVENMCERRSAAKRVLFVGRLIEEKGPADLLQAYSRLKAHLDIELECVVVGDGILRNKLEALALKLSIASNVHFKGWRPRKEIPSWMATADVLVVPSKSIDGWEEAQGLVVIEAMATGTVVVAGRLGGIPDMVRDGETGYLFEPGDVEQLTRTILRALEDDNSDAICKRASQLYESMYSSESICEQLKNAYSELVP